MPPASSTIRRTTAVSRLTKRTTTKPSSPDDLADQLAATLTISNAKGKRKAVVKETSISLEESRLSAMRAVNAASQTLSGLVQKPPPSKSPSVLAKTSAAAATKALKDLRTVCPGDVDVERAALSVVGKLVALDMLDDALSALSEMHMPLCNLYCSTSPRTSRNKLHLMSLPLPEDKPISTVVLTLISTYLLYAIAILCKKTSDTEALSTALCTTPTLLPWIPFLSTLPPKHLDSLLTRCYTALTKATLAGQISIRAYALTCLVHTTPGTVEPTTFWDQTAKFGASFVKSVPVSDEATASRTILSTFSDLTFHAESRPDKEVFLAGRGFVGFCEYWIAFAKRAGDVSVLTRIAKLVQGVQDSTGRSSALEGAKVCAIFAQTTASLEQGNGEDLITQVRETVALIAEPIIEAVLRDTEGEGRQVAGKVERGLERMRRVAVKMLEDGAMNEELGRSVTALLKGVASLSVEPSRDVFTRSLDTLFVLARISLNTNDPRTYGTAYDYLAKAASILRIDESIPVNRANFVRCVSGAFHNLAGTLYQAGRHGPAIRFLKDGCELGVKAINLRAQEGEDDDSKMEDGWKQLTDQISRRWELLGVCYSKIGDRKMAHTAFVESVTSFPFSESGFLKEAESSFSKVVFAASSNFKQLGAIVDRLTFLGACDLFLEPQRVSLKSLLSKDIAPVVTATLLERQFESLEGHMWKDGIRVIGQKLLADALEVYGDEMPVRRARLLLKCLEFIYHSDPEHASCLGDPVEMGQHVIRLLESQDLRQDVAFGRFSQQYRVSVNLWLALHTHRIVDTQQSKVVTQYANEAAKELRTLTNAMSASEPTPKTARKSSPKQIPVKRKVASRVPIARRIGAAKRPPAPVTPKPKPRKALEPVSLNIITPPRPIAQKKVPIILDDFDKLIALLQVTARVLGLLGLALTKVRVLSATRRLCEYHQGISSDAYVVASMDLASEYVKLGKTKKASAIYDRAINAVRSGQVSDEIRARFLLCYAESVAAVDNTLASSSVYCEALGLSEDVSTEEKSMSTSQRILSRVGRLERAAMASHVFALIQSSRNDMTASLEGLLQSLRLWNRAVENLARLHPPPPSSKKTDESNPFETPSVQDTTEQPPAKKTFTRRPSLDETEWRVAEGLLTALFALSQSYFVRGSAREAEYFAQQAQDLAESLNAPAMVSRALGKKGEVLLYEGLLPEAYETLLLAAKMLADLPGSDAAEIQRLCGDYSQRSARDIDACQLYEEATAMLEELDKTFSTLDGPMTSRRKSVPTSPSQTLPNETVAPTLLAAVLCQYIWLIRDEAGDDSKMLIEKLLALPPSSQIKAAENALMAKLTLHDAYIKCSADMFLSSLAESTIALPTGMSSDKTLSVSPSTQEILGILDTAETLFWADLALVAERGNTLYVRDAAVSLALVKALQTSLGRPTKNGPVLAASLLDVSSAITLRREMIETIHHKFPDFQAFDDLQWPLINPSGSPLPRPKNTLRSRLNFGDSDIDHDEIDNSLDDRSLKAYWEFIRVKYQARTFDAPTLSSSQMSTLPPTWTVVHISVTEDKSSLFVTRQRGGDITNDPLMFCVPLKGRRESNGEEEDEHLTFEDALGELNEIVRLSDEGTRGAVHVRSEDQAARVKWWKDRGELDTRMRELLENIEFCWLGAFKTILSEPANLPADVLSDLRSRFEKVFQDALHLKDKKAKPKPRQRTTSKKKAAPAPGHVTLDDIFVECFSTLSPKCKDEELEDLVYFILDLYQFHGVPVAIAEVDVDRVMVDLRGVLEEHSAKLAARRKAAKTDEKVLPGGEHIFLILDKNVQGIPWESIPILRGRSVSRIPNVDFLLDRVQLAGWKTGQKTGDRALVNPRRGYYILNPSGDLGRTEGRFAGWLKDMDHVGWEGIVGHPPSEQQFLDALSRKDLVVYFGHGGGEQYMRSHKIRHLPRCAATMLWGCSSGALKEMGDFDRVGTPYNYMLAGCPSLVANMWDVTDRDIDKFSQSVFDKLHLTPDHVRQWQPDAPRPNEVSVVAAVAQARDACKLKYLTGAAPVVYGIPFYL